MKKLIILSLFSIFIVCGCSNNKEKTKLEPLVIENTNTKETFKDNPKIEMTKEEEEKENIEITTKKMYVSAQNGLNIREFADENSKIIDTVPVNTELEVVYNFFMNDWYKVIYNDMECFVYKYISEEKVEVNKEQTNNSSSNGKSEDIIINENPTSIDEIEW